MKRSPANTRKRRNTALDLLIFKDSEKFNSVRDDFTIFKTLEKNIEHNLEKGISELPYEDGYDILNKASEAYLKNLNTPTEEPTKELPVFMNHGDERHNHFYVFEKEHADKIAYWQAVLVVSISVCLLLGALIISWRLHLPEWCYR